MRGLACDSIPAMRFLSITCIVAATVVSVSAQGEKPIVSRDGGCQVAVPAAWTVTALLASGTSPDKTTSVTVASPKMIDSFAELKQLAQTTYKQSKVTKDSATEFEMEGQSITGKPDVYRAVPASAGKFCTAEVIYAGGSADGARKVAESLKPAK